MIAALFLAVAAPAAPSPAPAAATATPDPARIAAARQLLDTILPPATRDATFAEMVNVMMVNMTRGIIQGQGLDRVFDAHPDAAAIFARFVDRQRTLALDDLKRATPDLMEAQAQAYARRFDLAELTAIRAFFATPVGEKYRVESVKVMGDPAVARWQSDLTSRSQARLKGEVEKLIAELKPVLERDAQASRDKPS